MANDVILNNNVAVGRPIDATGGILAAPLGTTIPSEAGQTINATFKPMGLIGEDGVEETADRNSEKVKAWGGSTCRVLQTEFGLEYKFTFLETNTRVLSEIHGVDNVSKSGPGLKVLINEKTLPHRTYIIQIKDGDNKITIALPNAQITEVGNIKYSHKDAIAYEVTVTCYKDAAGNEAYKFIEGPAANDADEVLGPKGATVPAP